MIRAPRLSLAQVQAALAGQEFDAVPTEGSTVNAPNTSRDLIARLNGATDLLAVTFTLPNEASARTTQRVFIRSQNQIATLSVTAEVGVTVDNATVLLAPGDCVVFYRAGVGIWSKVS